MPAASSGFLVRVDESELLAIAVDCDVVIAVDRSPGEWVTARTPVATTWAVSPATELAPDRLEVLRERIAAEIRTGSERTPVQDIGYGLRQLTDVANKALSPGINDPTTAIHALGHSAALLCDLAGRRLGSTVLRDDDGAARVFLQRPDLGALLDLTVSQPRHYGASDAAVLLRLFALLRELAWCTTDSDDQNAIAMQLARLRDAASREDFDEFERTELDRASRSVDAALVGGWA